MSPSVRPSIVIIDDDAEYLGRLSSALERYTSEDGVLIERWRPVDGEDPFGKFEEIANSDTALVITDYDLTKSGLTGLFGVSIVSWCQARFIPAADFSRGARTNLPREPNLFELRMPTAVEEAARYGAAIYRGFMALRQILDGGTVSLESVRSPAEVLAAAIERPQLESQLSLYMSLLGGANASLLDSLRSALSSNVDDPEKARLLAYVIGHVLANAVLRYPGPILSEEALCSYLATTREEAAVISPFFAEAKYEGPFSSGGSYYWREDVDEIISSNVSSGDGEFETSGQFNRAVAERMIERPLARHGCERCGGINGGYWCPFTTRPVCERADCSVAANAWIPLGADVCRVERDFYDEWSPLLGL
jgi:hypothetical protein